MSYAVILCVFGCQCSTAAQEPPHPTPVSVQRWSLAAKDLEGAAQTAPRGSSRDSVKDGAILGAAIGAASLGALATVICKLYQEEGGASCGRDIVRGAAIGAAIGLGAGVAVDAALARHAGVAVRIGVAF